MPSGNFELHGAVRGIHLKDVNENLSTYSTFSSSSKKSGTRDTHKILLRECIFLENQNSENRILLRGLNKFLSFFSAFIVQFN